MSVLIVRVLMMSVHMVMVDNHPYTDDLFAEDVHTKVIPKRVSCPVVCQLPKFFEKIQFIQHNPTSIMVTHIR
jgi:hypothetical protein